MGERGEKSLRFVVCAVQERYTRAEVLFVFYKTKVLFVTGKETLETKIFPV